MIQTDGYTSRSLDWGWKHFVAGLSLVATLSSSACTGSKSSGGSASSIVEATPRMVASAFDADSAYRYISEQISFGPRHPGSKGHEQCAMYIADKLRSWGYVVTEQVVPGVDYYGKAVKGINIIASLPSEESRRLLLMAHWDTRAVADADVDIRKRKEPILGADDGASGVGVLLELARQYAQRSSDLGLDFVFFDLEDGGNDGNTDSWCLGSQYWATHPHVPAYKAEWGILLDMVGARGARFYYEEASRAYAAPLLYMLWETAGALGWGKYFVREQGGAMIDDHIPVIQRRKIPCVDIINYDPARPKGFGDHWHTHGDNLNLIDIEVLRAVGETVATTIDTKLK